MLTKLAPSGHGSTCTTDEVDKGTGHFNEHQSIGFMHQTALDFILSPASQFPIRSNDLAVSRLPSSSDIALAVHKSHCLLVLKLQGSCVYPQRVNSA